MEWITEVRELFGDKILAAFVFGTIAYCLLLATPFLIPAWRAFSKRDRLPKPWWFVLIAGGLSYGLTDFLLYLITLPSAAFSVYFVPSLKESGLLRAEWLFAAIDGFIKWWWVVLPFAYLAMTIIVTRSVGQRWRKVCNAMAA